MSINMNNHKKIIIVGLLVLVSFILFINFVLAFEPLNSPLNITIDKPADVYNIIGQATKAILGLVGSAVLVMFIYGGISWLMAGGSEEKIKKAKETLIWSVFGLLVIFASYALLNFTIQYITIATGVSTEAFSSGGGGTPPPSP